MALSIDPNNVKISACILSRNDSQLIEECIDRISPYIDEIIILDASDDNETDEIIKNKIIKNNITKNNNPPIIYKKGEITQDFSKERNDIQSIASGDYVLHVDCDEIFDIIFLSSMKNTIKGYLGNGVFPILFRFPRLNLPDRVNYPDYQIRLLYKKYTRWIRKIHEIPEVIPFNKSDIGMDIHNLISIDYPIVHLNKIKTDIWKRSEHLKAVDVSHHQKKLLFISMFRNSSMWLKDILSCMYNFYQFNRNTDELSRLDINFSFIDGRSNDGTFEMLRSYCKEGPILNVQLRDYDPDIDYEDSSDKNLRFKKLAMIRNYAIEQSVSQFPLDDDDYIIFADADVKFNENVIHELIKDIENCKCDIIAPMVYIEDFREFGNSYFYDTLAFRSLDGMRFNFRRPYTPHMDMGRPNQVNSVGSFYIMKYKVAKNIKFTGDSDSEQVEFCNRAISQGFEIFVSPRLSVFHINLEKYGITWH